MYLKMLRQAWKLGWSVFICCFFACELSVPIAEDAFESLASWGSDRCNVNVKPCSDRSVWGCSAFQGFQLWVPLGAYCQTVACLEPKLKPEAVRLWGLEFSGAGLQIWRDEISYSPCQLCSGFIWNEPSTVCRPSPPALPQVLQAVSVSEWLWSYLKDQGT